MRAVLLAMLAVVVLDSAVYALAFEPYLLWLSGALAALWLVALWQAALSRRRDQQD